MIDAQNHTISFYMDGKKTGELKDEAISLALVTDQSRNTIGRAPYDDPMFKGSVSTFRVYDRALSDEEIMGLSDRDAALHEDYFKQLAKDQADAIGDISITDSRTALPDFNGTVTWSSDMEEITISENGISATVKQPAKGGQPVTGELTATATVRGQTASAQVPVTIHPAVDADDAYGYMMVHFIEDSAGYAEKIYLDISRGDDPEYWDPLNNGEPILCSDLSTTGVRDPYLTYNPENQTYYIIATDLRVFGGDNAGWGAWQNDYSTKMNVWESKDLITWSEQRQFDVALNTKGEKQARLGMMWAPEATWVPDYYGEGDGAFVVYWSSVYEGGYSRIMWGATKTFTQEDYTYGGIFLDPGYTVIDTTIIQNEGKTYHVTKSNGNSDELYMQVTERKDWWNAERSDWKTIQTQIGKQYFGAVEGPAMFADHSQPNRWYLFVDDLPTPGYQPMITNDLDKGWERLESPNYYLRQFTKHGGVVSLTKKQYDAVRSADVRAAVPEDQGTFQVPVNASQEDVRKVLPDTVEADAYYHYGKVQAPVEWDLSAVKTSEKGEYEVEGTLKTIGANLNQWVGKDGNGEDSTEWDCANKEKYSSMAVKVKATVEVTDQAVPVDPPADKTALEKAIADANQEAPESDKVRYTDASWTAYEAALKNANDIYKKADASQDEVDKAKGALTKALNKLISVDTDVLEWFNDVHKDENGKPQWYVSAVDFVLKKGIMTGYENDEGEPTHQFGVETPLTRAEFAKILYEMTGNPTVDPAKVMEFEDAKVDWYVDYVKWASSNGIIKGYDDRPGYFGPADNITREQMAVMMYRYVQEIKGEDGILPEEAADHLKGFADHSNVSSFATEAMGWAVKNGVLNGEDAKAGRMLAPQGDATREKCAQILMNYLTAEK